MPHTASLRIRPTSKGVSYDVRYRVDEANKTLACTDNACPTCGPICGMREFGWEPNDDRS